MELEVLGGLVAGLVGGWGARWAWTATRRRRLTIATRETGEVVVSLEPGRPEELEAALTRVLRHPGLAVTNWEALEVR
jgi:hypothetical protein